MRPFLRTTVLVRGSSQLVSTMCSKVSQITGREISGREFAGGEIAGREIAGVEIAGREFAGGNCW